MNYRRLVFRHLCWLAILTAGGIGSSAQAALPAEAKKEIAEIRKQVGDVAKLIRDKSYDEASKLISDATAKLDEIARNAGPEDANDRTLTSAQAYVFDQKGRLLAAKGVSFATDIAPIFNERCMGCHLDNPGGNLDLSSFANMKRGGRSGPMLAPGNPQRSLLMAKLTAPDDRQRMPRNAAALSNEELLLINVWIRGGAKFDGTDETQVLSELIRSKRNGNMPKVEIEKATGTETVSFTKDIAPFMSRLCLGCHSGNNPRGGLSLETFEKMMEGGESGRVIIPGNVEGSRMFRLVGGLENPRMPQGQARITRQNYEDFKKWFEEGNKFDGDNPRTPLRQLVPSETQLEAERLAKLTPEEWEALRITKTEEQWKRTLPKEPGGRLEGPEFLLWGNVSNERLSDIDQLADKNLKALKAMFNDKSTERTFNGRLAVFVFKDRLGYEEFNLTIETRQSDPAMFGHHKITPSQSDAYIVLQDVGEDPGQGMMGFEANLTTQLTGVYLKKSGRTLPDWIVKGTGLYLASRSGDADYFKTLPAQASQAVSTIQQPAEIFAEGTFSPGDTAAVGYGLVNFLISGGGANKFGQFIDRIGQGSTIDAAARAIYQSDANTLAAGYLSKLPR